MTKEQLAKQAGGALVVALAILVAALPAAAETFVDKTNHFEASQVPGWSVEPSPDGSGAALVLAIAEHASGEASAAVVRVTFPNTPAWRKKAYYFDSIVEGLEKATDGFVLISKKRSIVANVPILDVRYQRDHASRPHVAVRFILFRTFTLIASAPSTRAQRKTAAAFARSVKPHL